MIGRRVLTARDERGTVERWEPLGADMCDALVRRDDGTLCWYASRELRPADGLGDLPSRQAARAAADAKALADLIAIRAKLADEIRTRKPWPGAEFGKVIIGRAIDGAIARVKERMDEGNKHEHETA